jgi:two-component system CheB/CheR fusion protein
VKERGGTVVIEDPVSASHPSMPLAIPPTLVDLVARPEAMGKTLAELLRGTRVPTSATEQNLLRALLTQLRDRSCIDFLQYKTPTIMRRLSRLMVANGVASVADYLRYLQSHPEGYQRLISAFLIKVTDFFRDEALFDELKNVLLPRLIAEAKQRGSELRIWSAGTSTGEEAYSLAILCADLVGDGEPVGVRIFATDVDDAAVAFARRGTYSREALRHVPPSLVERYFVRSGDAFEVGKRIRNMTVFGQHDLGQRAPFPHIDLCMCRNVTDLLHARAANPRAPAFRLLAA